jgi:uridine kinase
VTACRDAGLLADALCLQMHPAQTFVRRLARDLVESRKPPLTLVKRGLGLARGERAQVQRWAAAGCRPLTLPGAERALRTLGKSGDRPPDDPWISG